MVVLNMGRVIAVGKEKGATLWKTEKNYGHAYATPLDFEIDGQGRLAVLDSTGLAILDRGDGAELYFHEWKTLYDINAATPVVVGDKVFISSGLGHGCALLRLGGEAPEVLWESKAMANKMSGCIEIDGHLYGIDERNGLKCIDLEGEEKWRQREIGVGALVGAGDRLIVLSEKGELIIADASPASYRERSRAKVLDGGVCWTMPVISGGRIYCRNSEGELVCRDHRRRE